MTHFSKRAKHYIATTLAVILTLLLFISVPAFAQNVAEAARQERERRKVDPQTLHVYTNEDLSKSQILVPEDRARVAGQTGRADEPTVAAADSSADTGNLASTASLQNSKAVPSPRKLHVRDLGPAQPPQPRLKQSTPTQASTVGPIHVPQPALGQFPLPSTHLPAQVRDLASSANAAPVEGLMPAPAVNQPAPALPIRTRAIPALVVPGSVASLAPVPAHSVTAQVGANSAAPRLTIANPAVPAVPAPAYTAPGLALPMVANPAFPVATSAAPSLGIRPIADYSAPNPAAAVPSLPVSAPAIPKLPLPADVAISPSATPLMAHDAPAEPIAAPDVPAPNIPTGFVIPRVETPRSLPVAPVGDPRQVPPSQAATIQVQPGDSLWRLAQRYFGKGERWAELARLNPQLQNPSFLRPGDVLHLPSAVPQDVKKVVIRPGDTLWTLARVELGTSLALSCVAHANPQLQSVDQIRVGDVVVFPETCAVSR